MAGETICKTVHQYNQAPISPEDMKKLLEIAGDYGKVKNYVYARFGGVNSLSKLYPGYTVQKEMGAVGLREELGLPSVYFNLAVLDAVGELKGQWTRIKSELSDRVKAHQEFTDEEKHYLRFVLKVSNAFEMILNRKEAPMKPAIQAQYEHLASSVNTHKLDNYLRRQARKQMVRLHTDRADGFGLTERAYRYGDHGIYITIKEKRKRIFVPLTDNNRYERQLYIKLYPEKESLEIKVPVDVKVRSHREYRGQVGVSMGMGTMLVTDMGHAYGEKFGELSRDLSDWVWEQNKKRQENMGSSPGRKKYEAKKRRKTERLHSYMNMELNRFIREEKPETVYIPKLPKPYKHSGNKKINHSVTMWQRGYMRQRLMQKCREQGIQVEEVFGKEISTRCSNCKGLGIRKEGKFKCPECGMEKDVKVNAAINARKRGMEGPKIKFRQP